MQSSHGYHTQFLSGPMSAQTFLYTASSDHRMLYNIVRTRLLTTFSETCDSKSIVCVTLVKTMYPIKDNVQGALEHDLFTGGPHNMHSYEMKQVT